MINAAGMALLREFEGCKLVAYQDVAGIWTIGYGHTGPAVQMGLRWTKERAENQLLADVAVFAQGVGAACKVDPNDNQLAAMTCLAYNIGLGAFRKSTVLRMHNASKFAEAASAFSMWNKAGGEVRAGLTRRRAAETGLYLTPMDADTVQTTRAAPDASKDPATSKWNVPALTAAATAALTGAQQVVGQVETVWGQLYRLGINPHYLMGALGVAAVVGIGYFVYAQWRRNQEGDR